MIYLRETNFVTYIGRNGSFTLPGRTEAVRRYLIDNYEGIDTKANFSGKLVPCLQLTEALIC